MIKKILLSTVLVLLLCQPYVATASEMNSITSNPEGKKASIEKLRVACINMSLVTALHPKMSLFHFQAMGFLKLPLGLSYSEYRKQEAKLKENKKAMVIHEKISVNRKNIRDIREQRYQILKKEKAQYPDQMSTLPKESYQKLNKEYIKLLTCSEELEYELRFPQLTAPTETRKILQQIEKDVIEAIELVAKEKSYDIILNKSVNPHAGYPENYKSGAKYAVGLVGIEQTLYYGFLSEKSPNEKNKPLRNNLLKRWISMTSVPEVQDYIPLKPWPLVIKGGDSILTDVLKKLYTNSGISKETIDSLLMVLNEMNLVDQ